MKYSDENETLTNMHFCRYHFNPIAISIQKDLKPRKNCINELSEAQVYTDLFNKYIHM